MPAAGPEVLSTDVVTEELSFELRDEGRTNEEMHNPETKKTKSVRKKKSAKTVKTDHKPIEEVKDQKEASEFISKTHEETQESDQTLLPEIAPDDLLSSPALTTNVPEDQQTPRESLVSTPQHHVPSSSVPIYTLSYDGDLWKLISQIRDPQYVGETFMSKIAVVHCTDTRAPSNQANSNDTAEGEMKSLQSENLQRPLSPDSEVECRPMSPQSLRELESFRPASSHSGRSVDSRQALTPDSPVPEFFSYISGLSQIYHRSASSESVLSDLELETDVNISFLFEDRPASTDSVSPINIYSALSPDSPIPDFRPFLPESVLSVRLDQSPALETVDSDLECGTSCLSSLLSESRPSSPDSVDLNRPLSHESPIPVFSGSLPEFAVMTTMEMSSSPVSVSSDVEYEATSLSQVCSEITHSSFDSVASEDETGSSESLSLIAHPSPSPKSVVPEGEYAQSSEDIVLPMQSLDSPDSQAPDATALGGSNEPQKAIQVPDYRLVYDAELWTLISQIHDPHYAGETFCSKTGFFECVGTRTLYVPDDSGVKEGAGELDIAGSFDTDERNEREDVSVPQSSAGLANVSQSQPYSQESAVSDEESDPCMPLRSPMSFSDSRSLSPDSPLPDFTPALTESVTAVAGSRSSLDISDTEYDFSGSQDFSCQRADSPESGVPSRTNQLIRQLHDPHYDEVEMRPLLPELANEHRPASPLSLMLTTEIKTSSPDSTASANTFSQLEVEERPLSPDSESEYRPFTPTSLMFMSHFRSSSPNSTGSLNEFRALSPDSPVPDLRLVLQESLITYRQCRSSSPVSVQSDEDLETDLCLPWLFEDRAESPDSTTSRDEFRPLSPDSPIPEFTPELQASSISHMDSRSSSPELDFSDAETELSFPVVVDDRPSSPESLASMSKYRRLSNDSPLHDFSQALLEIHHEFTGYRSSSPESQTSDLEYVPLISEMFDFEDRSESRQSEDYNLGCGPADSPVPQYTINAPTISTSPDSVYSDEDVETDLCFPWLFEDRAESPDSVASIDEFKPLSPDSPIPQLGLVLQESLITYRQCRSSSPVSVSSDSEEEVELTFSMLFEDRPSSASSVASVTKYRRLSPDSPILDFTQALPVPPVDISGYRSDSPASVESDMELAPLISQVFEDEQRPDSPQSVSSFSEYQRLSPDSPVPYYSHTEPSVLIGMYRSTSPDSVYSDQDLETDLCIPWLFEDRAESPDSTTSTDEFRPLSPDSPIPQLGLVLQESLIAYRQCRSSSPVSVSSDSEEEVEFFSVLFEDRPSSASSVASETKYRRLSPDSPILDFTQALPVPPVDISGYRSDSPASVESDMEFAPLISQLFEDEQRPDSPQSVSSFSRYQRLSPDSPYIQTRTWRQICVSPGFLRTEQSLLIQLHPEMNLDLFLQTHPYLNLHLQYSVPLITQA
ncbi:hypothetical protein INR49_017169 [Caranx melampygus]|nr:hypothetical protein INR49_017169 [Caranx melampygus]